MRRRLVVASLAALVTSRALAQERFPSKPIRIVIPFPVGGAGDAIARALADVLSRLFEQPVIVDSKPGASGTIGAAEVARARADGYTLLLSTNDSLVHVVGLMKNLPYNTKRDFTFLAQIAATGAVLVTQAENPVGTLPQLVALAREKPGSVPYGSWGPGTHPQLVMGALMRETNTQFIDVPYKGLAPLVQDLLARQIPYGFVLPGAVTASNRRLKPIAMLGDRRSSLMPNVPTFSESSVTSPVFKSRTWIGLLAPANVPKPVEARLQEGLRVAFASAELRNAVSIAGYELLQLTREEGIKVLDADLATIPALMREIGIEAQ